MIEVFKTNVKDHLQAKMLIDQIHEKFSDYTANFDLDDCDRILRVKCETESIQQLSLISLMKNFGFHAEVLNDDQPWISSYKALLFESR